MQVKTTTDNNKRNKTTNTGVALHYKTDHRFGRTMLLYKDQDG